VSVEEILIVLFMKQNKVPTKFMKTERQAKDELKIVEQSLKKTQKQFDLYDNHDDMDEIERLQAKIEMLKWVLSK